jgi:hypothetical protein
MMESGYYPPGAEFDPNAPYNQSEPPEIPVELTATETMTKTITVYTNKVWRVYDEEGYGSYESDGFEPRETWDEQTDSLEITLNKALEEITALRKEAEAQQLKLEAHYGVRHNTIPGANHPDAEFLKMRKQLVDAMDRVRHLKALEDALGEWETEEREIEFEV